MKSLVTKESITKQMLQLISRKEITNYEELEAHFRLSKKTISKHLDIIDMWLRPLHVKLIRKQNLGIYLSGDKASIFQLFESTEDRIPDSKNERFLYILIALISHTEYITIQELADNLYVSRSTLESDLKGVKKYLSEYSIEIIKSKKGIKIASSLKHKRLLIGNIMNMFWRDNLFIQNEDGDLSIKGGWGSQLKKLVNPIVLHKVVHSMNLFFEKSNLCFSDYECQALIIHLIIVLDAIQREGDSIRNETMCMLHKDTIILIEILEEVFHCMIATEERTNINLHIVSALRNNYDNEMDDMHMEPFIEIQQITMFLKQILHRDLADDKLLESLSIHLSSAMKRSYNGIRIYNPYTRDVKKMFPEAYEESIKLKSKIHDYYRILLNDDECAFIALHFESLLENSRTQDTRITALLVCDYGIGSSRLLEQRIIKYFNQDIKVSDVISYQDLKSRTIEEDIIISTFPLDIEKTPLVVVTPILNAEEKRLLASQINQIKTAKGYAFFNVLDEQLIFHDKEITTQNQVIEYIGCHLIKQGYAKDGVIESAKKREVMSATSFDNIAIPHSETEFIIKPKISMFINKRGITWNDEKINIVFFMALNKEVQQQIRSIYHFLTDVLDNPIIMKQLVASENSQEVLQILKAHH